MIVKLSRCRHNRSYDPVRMKQNTNTEIAWDLVTNPCDNNAELVIDFVFLTWEHQDVRICVHSWQFAENIKVVAQFNTSFQELKPPETDLFVQYKQPYRRLRDHSFAHFNIVLLEDVVYEFALIYTALTTPVSTQSTVKSFRMYSQQWT